MKLRVLYLTACAEGGAAEYLRLHAASLPALGCTVIVAGPREGQLREALTALPGVEYVSLPLSGKASPLADLRCLSLIAGAIRAHRPHVVHSNGAKAGVLLAALSGFLSYPLVYSPHGMMTHHVPATPVGRLYSPAERWAGRRHDMIITVCQAERAEAIQSGLSRAGNTVVVYNGTDESRFRSSDCSSKSEAGLVVGTACRLHRGKGVDYLIRSLPRVLQSFPRVRMLVGGEGQERPALERLVDELGLHRCVGFVGHVTDMEAFLQRLDLFVHPSLWEGFPMVLLESGAAGIPVVATDVGGVRELIDDTTGWLVPPSAQCALSSAMVAALADGRERKARAARLRQRVANRHRASQMIQGTVGAYQRLREGRGEAVPR
jgi:glycosyltransferase involved in cell wall biosynthesis